MFFKISTVGLLVLGFSNPVSGSTSDLFLVFLLFGFVISSVFARDNLLILSLLLITNYFFYIQGYHFGVILLASALGVFVRYVLEKAGRQKLAIIVVMLIYLVSALASSNDLRGMLSRDLPLFTYNNDPGVFLKTYQMIEAGSSYYPSLLVAHDGRFAQRGIPTDIWGLRMPTLFYIWNLLPGGGIGIYYLFLAMSAFGLYCAYQISSRYIGSKLGLISSYLLFPYMHFAARDQMILETEWWGVLLFIFGFYFLLYKKYFLTTIFFALAVMVRELILLPVFLLTFYVFFFNRKILFVGAIPLVSFCVLFLFHLVAANLYIDAFSSLFKPRLIPFGYSFLQQTFAFGSWEYFFFNFKPFYVLFVLAIAGCAYIFKNKSHFEGLIVLTSFLIFPIAFLKMGTVPFNDYWGIMFMPQILVIAPIFLGWFRRSAASNEE